MKGCDIMGLVKTRRPVYPPLAGVRDPWGSEHASDAEAAAREGGDGAAGEEGRGYVVG